jgi:hypothetical protein
MIRMTQGDPVQGTVGSASGGARDEIRAPDGFLVPLLFIGKYPQCDDSLPATSRELQGYRSAAEYEALRRYANKSSHQPSVVIARDAVTLA